MNQRFDHNIDEEPNFFQDKRIFDWISRSHLLEKHERILSADYSNPREMEDYKKQQHNGWVLTAVLSVMGILFFIFALISTLVYLIVISFLILASLIVWILFLLSRIVLHKIVICTSTRLIILRTSINNLTQVEPNSFDFGFKIMIIPWISIQDTKLFEKKVPFVKGDPIYGIRVYSEDFGTHAISCIHDFSPFQFCKYIIGTNNLYNYNGVIPRKLKSRLDERDYEIIDIVERRENLRPNYTITQIDDKYNYSLAFSFEEPFSVLCTIPANQSLNRVNEKINNFNKELFLYDPLVKFGNNKLDRTFRIEIETHDLIKIKNSKGWILNLLISYFYTTHIPSDLEVSYSIKKNIDVHQELRNELIFTDFTPQSPEERFLNKLYKKRGIQSELYGQKIYKKGIQTDLIDFYPRPEEDYAIRRQDMVLTSHWIFCNGFYFLYEDIASILKYKSPFHDYDDFYIRLRQPIIWTTSSSNGGSTTHYKYGIVVSLPSRYAKNLESWLNSILF